MAKPRNGKFIYGAVLFLGILNGTAGTVFSEKQMDRRTNSLNGCATFGIQAQT